MPANCVAFTHVTMEGANYITVRETGQSGQNNVVIVDMANPTSPMRRQISADSAIMCPSSMTLALKAAQQNNCDSLQVFNLDTKAKVKTHTMQEKVEFWKWVTPSIIGLVTSSAVYHWSMDNSNEPSKMFDRAQSLAGNQIINYRLSMDSNWGVLIGLTQPPSGTSIVKGNMQLFSFEQNRSQSLDAHAAGFANATIDGRNDSAQVISFCSRGMNQNSGQVESKMHIVELGSSQNKPGFQKKQHDLFFPQGHENDFPISLQISERFGLVYIISKMGLLFVYDMHTATPIYRSRISQDSVFLCCSNAQTGGFYAINRKGSVMDVGLNEQAFVPFIANQLQNVDLALNIAKRGDLPGADELIKPKFEQIFQTGDYKQAAELAASSPKGSLRTKETMSKFQMVPTPEGQTSPLLQYFGACLQKGRLFSFEAIELAKLVLSQNRKHLLDNWVKDDKLEPSEELGDLIAQQAGDDDLALQIYERANVSQKVVSGYAVKGEFDKMTEFLQRTGYQPKYLELLQMALMKDPEGAVKLATHIANMDPPPVDLNTLANEFFQRHQIKEATSFLLDALKDDKEEHAHLQTKVLEVNLTMFPNVADAILSNEMFSHYDRPKIAQLCEKAGLFMRALQHYTDLADIKRVIVNAPAMDPQGVVDFFGTLSREDALECLYELMRVAPQNNVQIVVQVTKEYTQQLGADSIMELFEKFSSMYGLFLYLQMYINHTEDQNVHFKYIEAATKTNQISEVERFTRESSSFDPQAAKVFLMEARLPDARPLMNVCDRFGYAYDLTTYLHKNGLMRYIEAYVQKVNPGNAPVVVGALLDTECSEDFVKNLINSVRSLLPVDELTTEVEKRNKLKILNHFLENLVSEGSTNAHVHNALAKIVIDSNNNPEHFLKTNEYYDSKEVGKFCEKRDPTLAFIAYKRGECDEELVHMTNKNSLFKQQARYVVERMNHDLWNLVLSEENKHRRQLIDQVVSTALPESNNPEQVSVAVKAFMNNELPSELIELLEKIVLQNSSFSANPNLQNLLILTAVKADHTRVMDYVQRLDSFDGPAVADVALDKELYEEALAIYKKFKDHVKTVRVLIDNIGDLERALEMAKKVDERDVWGVIAKAQLDAGQISECIESYLKADDHTNYAEVSDAALDEGCFEKLVKFLYMVRKRVREQRVDSDLLYSLARINNLSELEQLLHSPNIADVRSLGDRCFRESLYEAAKTLYQSISAFGPLATTLVRLHQFNNAVEACRKANDTETWKEVCFACVEEKEFKLAQLCAHHIIVQADELDEVSQFYQERGHFDELLSMMEAALGLERTHMGIFTELAILYAKFRPERFADHLNTFMNRINIPRVIEVAQENALWKELVQLHKAYDEFDHASHVMMEHPFAFEHPQFKDTIVRVSNMDLYYKAVKFYIYEHPSLVNDLLTVLTPRVDHARIVSTARKQGMLWLVKPYLVSVQKSNIVEVNEALNELLVEEEDHDGLRQSIDMHDNFDHVDLAQKCEKAELLEFRRIASYIYKQNKRWRQSVALSKRDKLYKDAMITTAESGDEELAEELLDFFVQQHLKECFAACLYTCYKLVKPDVAMEKAWMAGMMDFVMPFMLQTMRDYSETVDSLRRDRDEAKQQAEQEKKEAERQQFQQMNVPQYLALPPTAQQDGYMPPQFANQGFAQQQQYGGFYG